MEGASGFLYLFSGIIFPASSLPGPLQIIANYNPLTWIANLFRASLDAAKMPDINLLNFFLISLLALLISYFIFKKALSHAVKIGILDQKIGH